MELVKKKKKNLFTESMQPYYTSNINGLPNISSSLTTKMHGICAIKNIMVHQNPGKKIFNGPVLSLSMGQFAYTVISKMECLLKQFGLSASLKGTTVDAEQPVVNLQVSTPLAYPPDHAALPVL